MCDKLSERKQREIDAIRKHGKKGGTQEVSDKELFARGSNLIKVEKKNGN